MKEFLSDIPKLSRRFVVSGACAAIASSSLITNSKAQTGGVPGFSTIRDTEIESFLFERTQSIFNAAGLKPELVRFYLIASDELNAWATVGLRMGLNTGLIMECSLPNELFGVIAHEAGHLAAGHSYRTEEVERSARAPAAIALGLGVIAAMAGAADAGIFLAGSAQTFGTLNALKYLQSQESAADAAAVRYLDASGMSGRGLVDFFNKFRNFEIFSDAEKFQFFRTHPLSRERIQSLRSVVEKQKNYDQKDPADLIDEFKIVKAKLSGFLNNPVKTYKTYPLSDTSFAARYARLIADYKLLEWEKSLKELDLLIIENPLNPYLYELKGQIYFETGRASQSLPWHQKSVDLKPQAMLFRLNLAQALLNTQKSEDARASIDHLNKVNAHDPDPFAFMLLAQAYDALKDPGQARLATAESQFHSGDYLGARTSAVWSQKHFQKNSVEFQRARDIVVTTSSLMGIDPVSDEVRRR